MTNPYPPYGGPQGYPPLPPPPGDPRAQAAADKAYRKASRPLWKKKRVIIPVALVVLVIFGSIAVGSGGSPSSSNPAAGVTATSNSVAPAQTAAPTTTPPPASPPTVHSGRGDDVVTITKDTGPAVVDFECQKCSSNTTLKTDGAESLLVNEIGAYKGRHLIDISNGSTTSTLTVGAKGAWKITISSGLGALQQATGPISGKGDDVIIVQGATTKAAITNKGESNFVVRVFGDSSDLAVNEIGSYQGTVPLDAPAVVQITSSGNWTITPS